MNKKNPESKAAPVRARPVAKKPSANAPAAQARVNDWQAVWMRAVALAWQDAAFEADLLKDPRQALQQRFDFQLPEGLRLKVVPASGPDAAAGVGLALQGPEVELPLPRKPADVADHAVALSTLMDTHSRSHCCGSPCC
jgi:ribosomally synthesized peptide (two-chain TOMM family)